MGPLSLRKESSRKIEAAIAGVLVVLVAIGKANRIDSLLARKDPFDRYENSTDFIESILARYMRETKDEPSLLHLIVQPDSDSTKKFSETFIASYSKYGVPLMSYERRNKLPIVPIVVPGRRCQRCSKFRHVVGIFERIEDAIPEEWRLSYDEIWNPRANIAVMITEEGPIDRYKIEGLLKLFWVADCANVAIVCRALKKGGTRWSIFRYDRTGSDRPSSSTSDNDPKGRKYLVEDSRLFPDKLKNLQGETITVSLYNHSPRSSLAETESLKGATGFDTEILRYASKRLNFSIRLITSEADATSHVVRLSCGRTVGPIGDVLTGQSEYLANGQFLESFHLYNDSLDFVYPRWRSRSVVLVRRKRPIPAALVRWSKPIAVNDRYGKRLFLMIGGFLGFVSIVVYLRLLKRRSAGETFLAVVGLALFQHLPKIGWLTSERIFAVAWIYGSFVMSTMYQGSLVNDLTAPPIYDDIDTLGDLLDRVDSLRLVIRPYERRILEKRGATADYREDQVERNLLDRAYVQLNFSGCLALMRKSANVACAIDESYGVYALGQVRRYELMLEKNPHLRVVGLARNYLLPPIHVLRESLVTFWKTYFVRRDFPYLELIDDTIGKAVEFGLAEKWLRDDRDTRFREPEIGSEPVPISLSHMDYTFALLAIGHLFSAFVFIAEILCAWVFKTGHSSRKIIRKQRRSVR